MTNDLDRSEMTRRWRLVLGGSGEERITLDAADLALDGALSALYNEEGRRGGLGASAPSVARWLGDIRQYFPSSVVQVMQRDALERLNMRDMLLQPEMLNSVQPDVHLVANLISLSRVIPAGTKVTARMVVRRVVDELMKKLEEPLRSAISGAQYRSVK